MNGITVLARMSADSPINKWLNENPLALGSIAIVIGAVLAGSGVIELKKGVAHDKYGNVIPGGMGSTTSIVRVIAGVAACVFGLYKIVAG